MISELSVTTDGWHQNDRREKRNEVTLTTILYADPNSEHPFVEELMKAFTEWNDTPRHNRKVQAYLGNIPIRYDENGIGVELRMLPYDVPLAFQGISSLTLLVQCSSIEGKAALTPGRYDSRRTLFGRQWLRLPARRTAFGIVTSQMACSDSHPDRMQYCVEVKGDLTAARRLYDAIWNGAATPVSRWQAGHQE